MAHRTVSPPPRPAAREAPASFEFPGCRPVRISREETADCERRLEYWDAATEIAMICDSVSVSTEALVQAALECRDEEDLLRLVAYPR